jgi:hypothetical protein
MRDVIYIPINEEETFIIASDNSGGIGNKPEDVVKVDYETLAYYGFRVAVMECLSSGGTPLSVVLHNFCGDEAWFSLVEGVQKGLNELSMEHIQITGSSESNIELRQSALGVTVIGKGKNSSQSNLSLSDDCNLAVIGLPLVGEEVISDEANIVPLGLLKWTCEQEEVIAVLPVGSKGIQYELNQLFSEPIDERVDVTGLPNLRKSSGPSTCFLVAYRPEGEEKLRMEAGRLFYPLSLEEV